MSQAYGIWRQVDPVHTMMKCRGGGGGKLNLNLGIIWRWEVSLTPRPLFHWQTDGILGLYLVNLYADAEISQDLAVSFFTADV
jgi:hypothetical protein